MKDNKRFDTFLLNALYVTGALFADSYDTENIYEVIIKEIIYEII